MTERLEAVTKLTILAVDLRIACPRCGNESDGSLFDPRGKLCECPICAESFTVSEDATLEVL